MLDLDLVHYFVVVDVRLASVVILVGHIAESMPVHDAHNTPEIVAVDVFVDFYFRDRPKEAAAAEYVSLEYVPRMGSLYCLESHVWILELEDAMAWVEVAEEYYPCVAVAVEFD